MKIRELVEQWEQSAKGRLTRTPYQVHLDLESAARLAALGEMYPKRQPEELLGELLGAALEELEASLPYVQGSQVVGSDEEGNPLYQDIGPTPRFLELSRQHLHALTAQEPAIDH
ncbi:pilin assembly protein [Phytopseudomonas dryadis]|uniref:Pilin assembly protein n=1 Tax=Phytopseudomonas dryadis TaxID=2487520 RepID=A0A4Q9R7A1_9GAMM|nr:MULTISPECIES: pilin assembly protein [Pseudomonas]TBU96432.1 pilin assembly protein [Pseudomonas dryadis]TBV03511.1 pilin assembly protein [Pseudomonas dryadis]TBV16563.1 pilin assembly protein [Pseudomonas sp. FRB 230]